MQIRGRRAWVVMESGWDSEGVRGWKPGRFRFQTPVAPGNLWPLVAKKITSDSQPKTMWLSWKKNSQGALKKIKKIVFVKMDRSDNSISDEI